MVWSVTATITAAIIAVCFGISLMLFLVYNTWLLYRSKKEHDAEALNGDNTAGFSSITKPNITGHPDAYPTYSHWEHVSKARIADYYHAWPQPQAETLRLLSVVNLGLPQYSSPQLAYFRFLCSWWTMAMGTKRTDSRMSMTWHGRCRSGCSWYAMNMSLNFEGRDQYDNSTYIHIDRQYSRCSTLLWAVLSRCLVTDPTLHVWESQERDWGIPESAGCVCKIAVSTLARSTS